MEKTSRERDHYRNKAENADRMLTMKNEELMRGINELENYKQGRGGDDGNTTTTTIKRTTITGSRYTNQEEERNNLYK